MEKKILIIGGTRYFGKLLVQQLVDEGHDVTIATRGQAPDAFGDQVSRIRVDRRDLSAMETAFSDAPIYDVIYDQMCYSPLDAQISVEVFSGKVKRYVMASTIEVYDQFASNPKGGFDEADFHAQILPYDLDFPWHDDRLADVTYGEGKRQAEAYFAQRAPFDVVPVRIAHVISMTDDFTGRVAFYHERLESGAPIPRSQEVCRSSFITPQLLVQFMVWVGQAGFRGPVNASAGELTMFDLVAHLAPQNGQTANFTPVSTQLGAKILSPFDYPQPFFMSTDRARDAGFQISPIVDDQSGFEALLPTKSWEL